MQSANSTDILHALKISTSSSRESFPWSPVIDGVGGVLPDLPSRLWEAGHFARLPFIAGTNLDEGMDFPEAFMSHTDTEHQHITGTFFTPQGVNSSTQISRSLISGSTPSDEGAAALNVTVSKVLQLYPDIPAIGSPYGTGNDTFGLSSQYKRDAAIGESIQTTQFWFVPNEDSSGGLAFPVSAANLDEDSQPAQPYNLWIFVYGS